MRENGKRLLRCLLAAVIGALFFGMAVFADEYSIPTYNVPKKVTLTLYSSKNTLWGEQRTMTENLGSINSPIKVKNMKVSDKSVAAVKKTYYDFGEYGSTSFEVTPKKAGTTTLSFKWNGKTYKTKITVIKYSNPIESIKIGKNTISGTKFKTQTGRTLRFATYGSSKSQKITVKLKKGWKLQHVEYFKKGWMKSDFVKGNRVKINKDAAVMLAFDVVNSSTGQKEDVWLRFK